MKLKLNSIGFDVELFVREPSMELVNPSSITSGTKVEPEDIGHGYTLQQDGATLELGSRAPCSAGSSSRWQKFCNSAVATLIGVIEMRGNYLPDWEAIGVDVPVEWLEDEAIATLGCEGDYNAWEYAENKKPDARALGTYRCRGTHLHLGVTGEDGKRLSDDAAVELVKALDITMGAGYFSRRGNSAHKVRSNYYGMAGSFRFKPYGIEYRSPSSFWLNYPAKVYNAIEDAIDIVNSGELEELIDLKGGSAAIIAAVDSGISILSNNRDKVVESTYLSANTVRRSSGSNSEEEYDEVRRRSVEQLREWMVDENIEGSY